NSLTGAIAAQNQACNGLQFSGEGEKVLEPFILPHGLYKITVKTTGFFILNAQTLSGSDCKAGVNQTLFNLSDEQTKSTAQTTLNIAYDCRILLSTSNSSAAWALTFEPIQ